MVAGPGLFLWFMLPLCPEIVLDPLGHHAVTCKRGGDVVSRHNKLSDVLAESCSSGCPGGMGNNLTSHSRTCPADLLVPNWVLGKQQLSYLRLILKLFRKQV